jgi:hypothetical protein
METDISPSPNHLMIVISGSKTMPHFLSSHHAEEEAQTPQYID